MNSRSSAAGEDKAGLKPDAAVEKVRQSGAWLNCARNHALNFLRKLIYFFIMLDKFRLLYWFL